jgi:hypothetical protein
VHVKFSDDDLCRKAVHLGLIKDGEDLPRHLRSRAAAALVQETNSGTTGKEHARPQLAREITIQPGGAVLVDGEPFPWLIAKQPMEINLNPDGVSTVRMTLLADRIQVLKPEPRTESE